MSLKNRSRKGFTLVELLIVIAVIGLLAAAVIAVIKPAKQLARARDTIRKQRLQEIRDALERYYSAFGKYPAAGACALGSDCWVLSTAGDNWIPALVDNDELKQVPKDPKNAGVGPWVPNSYTFAYGDVSADAQEFDLVAQLEDTSDPDRCELKNYLRSKTVNRLPWCWAFGGNYNNQIYTRSPANGN